MRLLLVLLLSSQLWAVTYISKATGNFTVAGTWAPISAVAAAELDSETGSTASTTSFVYSVVFTPGAVTADGIAVKVAARTASPTGTMTIELYNNTLAAPVTEVVINASDVDASGLGWYFFKFGSSQLLIVANDYKIGLKTSVTATVSLYRDGTAGNWSRMLRLTSAASAPASADKLMLMGEWTAAGALTSFTVTMDNTATTSFGPTVSGGPPQGMTVNKGATFTWGVTASTAYYLKWKGIMGIYGGATVNVGTSGTPMPSSSSAVLEMDSVANVDTGIRVEAGATFNAYGATKTVVWTYLNTDEAAAATVIGVVSTAGWAVSDELAFAPTTRTYTEGEKKTILTVDSGVQITLTAGLTNAHSGTSPTQAEVGNLTRNVKVRGISVTLQGYVWNGPTAIVTMRYVELYQLGSVTANKRGIDVQVTTGTFDAQFCSVHDLIVSQSVGVNHSGLTSGTVVISSNVFYNNAGGHYRNSAMSGTGYTLDSNLFILTTNSGGNWLSVVLDDIGGTVTNNSASGSAGAGFYFGEVAALGTFSGNTAHSTASVGFHLNSSPTSGTILNSIAWRNTLDGMRLQGSFGGNVYASSFIIDGLVAFGNALYNVQTIAAIFASQDGTPGLWFKNITSNGDTTFSTQTGIFFNNHSTGIRVDNSAFSVVTGIKTAHTTQDIALSSGVLAGIDGGNVILSAPAAVTVNNTQPLSYVSIGKFGQVAGAHKSFYAFSTGLATIGTDTVIFRTASPSVRMTPIKTAVKFASPPGKGLGQVAVANGVASTPSVYVRLSVVGDGAAYNGAAPRLFVRTNPAVGINTDTLLATHSGATGVWELMTGTTVAPTDDGILEFYIDCDGTAGWINIDDFTVLPNGIWQGGMKYWLSGLPGTSIGTVGGAFSAAFVQ
jgi:hypothetical protein